MDLMLHRTQRDRWLVLSVGGELDLATAPALRSELLSLAASKPTMVALDLGGVGFIDSVALGVLVGARRRFVAAGARMALIVTDERVRLTLEQAGVAYLFEIAVALEELR